MLHNVQLNGKEWERERERERGAYHSSTFNAVALSESVAQSLFERAILSFSSEPKICTLWSPLDTPFQGESTAEVQEKNTWPQLQPHWPVKCEQRDQIGCTRQHTWAKAAWWAAPWTPIAVITVTPISRQVKWIQWNSFAYYMYKLLINTGHRMLWCQGLSRLLEISSTSNLEATYRCCRFLRPFESKPLLYNWLHKIVKALGYFDIWQRVRAPIWSHCSCKHSFMCITPCQHDGERHVWTNNVTCTTTRYIRDPHRPPAPARLHDVPLPSA